MHTALRSVLSALAILGSSLAGGCARAPAPLTPAAIPASGSVLLRLRHFAGEARRFEFATAVYVHLGAEEPPAADSLSPMMRMTQFVTESVTAVSGDTFTVAYIVDSSRATAPLVNLPTPLPDSLAPRGLMMTMRMDSRGRVASLQMDRAVLAEGQRMVMRTMLGPGDSAGSPARLGSAISLPDGPARPGDTWVDTAPCPRLVHDCEGGVVTTSRLERIERSGARRIAVITSQSQMPPVTIEQPMEITTGPTRMASETRLDLEDGWFVEQTMTARSTAHSPMGDMSTRFETRQTAVSAAPQSGAGTTAPAAPPPMPPGFRLRRGNVPTPTTLDSLIALFKQFEPTLEFPECRLPDVAPAPNAVTLEGPDAGLRIGLPQGWHLAARDSTPFGDPEARLADSASSRLRVTRVTRASGLQHLMKPRSYGMPTELPVTGRCRLGAGTAGSLWTLYAPDPEVSAGPGSAYAAMGDLITTAGRRYQVTVHAPSAAERDRLVRIVADAAQASP